MGHTVSIDRHILIYYGAFGVEFDHAISFEENLFPNVGFLKKGS